LRNFEVLLIIPVIWRNVDNVTVIFFHTAMNGAT